MSPKNGTAIHEPIKAMKTMTNAKTLRDIRLAIGDALGASLPQVKMAAMLGIDARRYRRMEIANDASHTPPLPRHINMALLVLDYTQRHGHLPDVEKLKAGLE